MTSRTRPDGTVIHVTGELDIATADHLLRFVKALPSSDCRWVHLDLADLVFIDAAGLTALMCVDTVVTERAGWMTIGRPRALARQLVEFAELPLTIVDDLPGQWPGPGERDRSGSAG